MPVTPDALERVLAELNAKARRGEETRVEKQDAERFTLSFHDKPQPEGRCIDEDFADVQFVLSAREGVDANLVGARFDEDAGRFLVDYEVVEWD